MWTMDLQSLIFSRIKNEFPQKKKDTYDMTDDNFSTVASSSSKASFPFIFLKMLPASERGQDLEGTNVNGGYFTVQIDVTDNHSQNRANDVMSEVMRIMKKMRFQASAMPEFDAVENTHTCTARFSRVIGMNDKL